MKIFLRKATGEDLPAILALFDNAVAWLSDLGLDEQWGTQRFSENPQVVDRFRAWAKSGDTYIAQEDQIVLGAVVLSRTPPSYTSGIRDYDLRGVIYLEAFVTERRFVGRKIGAKLLVWAEQIASELGISRLQLDCWAENKALREYYSHVGFSELREFNFGGWRGVLFQKSVL